jgi:hypothetical protein
MTQLTNQTMVLLMMALGCGGASFGMGGGASAGGGGGGGTASEVPPPGEGAEPAGGGNWTLAEREFWKQLQTELDEFTKRTNEHCHSQIGAAYSQETYRGKLTEGGSYGMPQHMRAICTGAIRSVRDVCLDGSEAKQAVASSIRHVQCALGKTGYTLGKGTLYITYDPNDSDQVSYYTEAIMAYLRSHL